MNEHNQNTDHSEMENAKRMRLNSHVGTPSPTPDTPLQQPATHSLSISHAMGQQIPHQLLLRQPVACSTPPPSSTSTPPPTTASQPHPVTSFQPTTSISVPPSQFSNQTSVAVYQPTSTGQTDQSTVPSSAVHTSLNVASSSSATTTPVTSSPANASLISGASPYMHPAIHQQMPHQMPQMADVDAQPYGNPSPVTPQHVPVTSQHTPVMPQHAPAAPSYNSPVASSLPNPPASSSSQTSLSSAKSTLSLPATCQQASPLNSLPMQTSSSTPATTSAPNVPTTVLTLPTPFSSAATSSVVALAASFTTSGASLTSGAGAVSTSLHLQPQHQTALTQAPPTVQATPIAPASAPPSNLLQTLPTSSALPHPHQPQRQPSPVAHSLHSSPAPVSERSASPLVVQQQVVQQQQQQHLQVVASSSTPQQTSSSSAPSHLPAQIAHHSPATLNALNSSRQQQSTSLTATSANVGGVAGGAATVVAQQTVKIENDQNFEINKNVSLANRIHSKDVYAKILPKLRLQELVKEVDPMQILDEEVEECLLQITDEFIESVVTGACKLAKHRKAGTIEVKDVQFFLERSWNMFIPGYGNDESYKSVKKSWNMDAHKARLALIKKLQRKY